MPKPSTSQTKTTLLDLIANLQSRGITSERALVNLILGMVARGQVNLTGSYKGTSPHAFER